MVSRQRAPAEDMKGHPLSGFQSGILRYAQNDTVPLSLPWCWRCAVARNSVRVVRTSQVPFNPVEFDFSMPL